jgi:pentatricopeptide repeat protein
MHLVIPTFGARVVLRSMTAEERRISFDAFTEYALHDEKEDWVMSCSTALVNNCCLEKAIHEEDVGSAEDAQVLWDSLRVALETIPPTGDDFEYRIRALIHMEVGEREAALEMARTAVRLYPSEGCRRRQQSSNCTMLARVLARFGEVDEAIDILEEMLPAPSYLTVHLLDVDPIWDPLRSHPRFQTLLEAYADDVEH